MAFIKARKVWPSGFKYARDRIYLSRAGSGRHPRNKQTIPHYLTFILGADLARELGLGDERKEIRLDIGFGDDDDMGKAEFRPGPEGAFTAKLQTNGTAKFTCADIPSGWPMGDVKKADCPFQRFASAQRNGRIASLIVKLPDAIWKPEAAADDVAAAAA